MLSEHSRASQAYQAQDAKENREKGSQSKSRNGFIALVRVLQERVSTAQVLLGGVATYLKSENVSTVTDSLFTVYIIGHAFIALRLSNNAVLLPARLRWEGCISGSRTLVGSCLPRNVVQRRLRYLLDQ